MIGSKLAHYEITGHLGSGGMGDVYQATDKKLGRSVAIKFLPEAFSHDEERVARFQREARVLASLNHPNIAAIHGVEEVNGRHFLVMELVSGETLAEQITRGGIPIEDALPIATQLAEALEEAHEKGIVHRDLKPANIKVTPDGKVKVLDFGLAKAYEQQPADVALSNSPTQMSVVATNAGVILGTVAYMAPEQARGKQVDRRTDIWAFGATVFEMLTGRRAFEGETVSDTIAKILEREPDWNRLPRHTPDGLQKLLQHCLTKNIKDRLQAIGDARTVLQELVANPKAFVASEAGTAAYPAWKKVLPWVIAPLFLAAGWILKPSAERPASVASRFEYVLPNAQHVMHSYRHGLELSPDGKRLAFVAGTSGDIDGFTPSGPRSIYVKRLDQWDASEVPGTKSAMSPFFSPDGQWLGFYLGRRLIKVPLAGGAPVVLAEKINTLLGGTWSKTGTIVFASDIGGGLKSIPDTGGEPQSFTELDKNADEASHRLPHFLPDGSAVLFTVVRYTYAAPDWKRAQIWAKVVKTGERKLLIEDALDARYTGDKHLVFARQGKLFAVGFDPATLSMIGSPAPVLDGITHAVAGIGVANTSGAAQFSVSENGSLVYAPGSIEPVLLNSMVWVDRRGNATPAESKPISHGSVRISPDGKRIATTEYYVDRVISVVDVARGTQERQTFDGHSADGVWSPDGQRLVFRSNNSGPTRLYMKSLNSPDLVPLTPGPLDFPGSFTPDGKEFVFSHGEPGTNSATYDVYVVSLDQPNKPKPLLNTQFSETYPALSPDGHWLAYCSDESGRSQLYVQPYPGPGKRVTVSTDGAAEPAWSRDGRELFYRNGDAMMSVAFKTNGTEFLPEKPVALFRGGFLGTTPARMYDVAPDGRFLMLQPIPAETAARDNKIFPSTLRIVLNWTAELEAIARDRKQ